jgi:pyridoxal phosphate enzyme (YggS family)
VSIIKKEIYEAAISCGRDPSAITLCAATKMNGKDKIQAAIEAGIDCCGENKVQEFMQKMSEGAYKGAPVHFIGHLQTNKVRHIVGKVDLIQSVDSFLLLSAIQKEAQKQEVIQDILLEINIGSEPSKFGFDVASIHSICQNMCKYPNIRVRGFMTIPPKSQDSEKNHKFFQEMYNLSVDITTKKYDNVLVDILSMGMSDDFTEAIACGSTMVRIGTAIFGSRNY